MPLLLLIQGAPLVGLDLAAVIDDALPTLGAAAIADLIFWDEYELYDWLDEAAKELARTCGVFVVRDASISIQPNTPVYAVPTGHLSTIHASAGARSLLPATVQELEALDDNWPDTVGASPERFLTDEGTEQIRVYPKPTAAAGALALIFHRYPATVVKGSAVVSAPRAVREYFLFHVLAEARDKESKAAMPEVSAYFRQLADLHRQAIQGYWGEAQ